MNPATEDELEIQKRNFRNVQIDGVGVSISNVSAPYPAITPVPGEAGLSNRWSCIIRFLALALVLNSGAIGLASAASTSGLVLTRIAQVETGDAYDVRVDAANELPMLPVVTPE